MSSGSVQLKLGINGAFVTRRWEKPESMMRLTAETGYSVHEFCADVIDPFFMGPKDFLLEMAGASEVEVGIEYQAYRGFAEAMYNTEWTAVPAKTMTRPGRFEVEVRGLKPGVEYQYRAFVKHPKITMRGDYQRVTAR